MQNGLGIGKNVPRLEAELIGRYCHFNNSFWPTALALGVVTSHVLLHPILRSQLVHPFQKDLASCLALFVLVLGFGESQLIHGGGESYAVYYRGFWKVI